MTTGRNPRSASRLPADSLRYNAPEMSVDLHRMTAPQAIAAVDRALSRAAVPRAPYLRIVHGHGTGALRTAVTGHIRHHALVARWETAAPAEGGQGVTVVYLTGLTPKRLNAAEAAQLSKPVPLKRK